MIIHAASIAAFFVDQVTQAPVQVQCVQQAAPSPEWKWWMSALAPWVGPLLSGVVSIYVAWKVFHWQGEKDRKQWIRDQRRAEWKDLLVKIAEIEHEIPIRITGFPDHQKLEPIVLSILPLLRGTIFVYDDLENSGFLIEWESFVRYVSERFMMIVRTNRSVQTGTLGDPVFPEDRTRFAEKSINVEIEIRDKLYALIGKLRGLAHKGLEMRVEKP
jgi:hypothetical protein